MALAALLIAAVLHTALYPAAYASSSSTAAILFYSVPGVVALTLSCWRLRRSAGVDRVGWSILAAAVLGTVMFDASWNVVSRLDEEPPYPSWFDAPYLVTYAMQIAAIGLLTSPLWRSRDRRWLFDAGVLLVVAAGLGWHIVLPRAGDGALTRWVSFAYIVLDLAFLGTALTGIYRGRITARNSLLLLVAITLAVADVAYYYYPLAYDSTWNVGHWLIALAAVLPPSLTLRVPPLRMIRSGALPYTAAAGMAVFTAFELQHENAVDLLLTCVAALGLVVVKQIVALRQALAIQRQETAFREAVLETQSDLGLAMVILEGRKVIFANKAAEQITGLHASQLSAMPSVQGLAFEADREDWDAWLADPSGPDDARLARPDGTVLEIEVVARWMHSAGDPRLLVVARDVTARRQAEVTLAHAQRLEGLGALAGGVAHDFNNLLAAILGNVGLLQMGELDDEAREVAASIETAARHGASLTRSLLDFSRPQPRQFTVEDLRDCLTEGVGLARTAFPANVRLRFEPGPVPIPVRGDSGQLVQAFLNLVLNARDAVGDTGDISITTRIVPGSAVVEVTDSGHGMDPETQGRIFEPFFTTKTRGAGTGLGLAISHRTIRDHRGTIEVRSTPGVGTTFTVTLPLSTFVTSS